uniref:F-box domain-containing protein n=1 Tax=Brassica oleracea TaxID=3712 RepID=A0A3P6AA14_BRAOL|nr:unnamed protein product [Brassica oleracea]
MDSIKNLKEIAAYENLPWEPTEEILSRVSPKSLVRFRVVCKRWKATLDDKTFIYKHKETFLTTKSKIYSVSVDPKIVVRELTLDIPGLESQNPKKVVNYDEFLICSMDKGAAVVLIAMVEVRKVFTKLFGVQIPDGKSTTLPQVLLHSPNGVLLNGTLFWIIFADPLYILCTFQFSSEEFYGYCKLPSGIHPSDVLVINVCKGDRFSVLKQCHITKKIEILGDQKQG